MHGVNPVMASMKLVLPAPFGPISPTISPARTSMLTPVDGAQAAVGDA